LPNAKATIRPGSILNRQGGSVFDRPEQSELDLWQLLVTVLGEIKTAVYAKDPEWFLQKPNPSFSQR